MTVATPISMPQTQVMVYGMELTGDTPRLDLTDSAADSHDEEAAEVIQQSNTEFRAFHAYFIPF